MSDLATAKPQNNIGETLGTWEYRLPWWQEKLAAILGHKFQVSREQQREIIIKESEKQKKKMCVCDHLGMMASFFG